MDRRSRNSRTRILGFTLSNFAALLICFAAALQAADLRVSDNQRYLVKDGQPFFYLCDSGWDVFMMADRAEADEYLQNRADKGFNVIMAILIGWKPAQDEVNAYGEPPLVDKNPTRPNEKYFEHVDYIVNKANSLGMFVAIVPAWSDWMYKNVGPGPHPFNAKNAQTFGEYVGRRYRNNDVIWVIGGDRDPAGYEDILQAMVAGLDDGDGERDFLMTFHGSRTGKPIPPENVYNERFCSSHLFGSASWLDFHGAYSGHQWAYPTYRLTALDRAMKPTRPVIDLEPCYENHAYIVAGQGLGENHLQAARAVDGKFLFVYSPRGYSPTIDMTKIQGSHTIAHWFNPRSGETSVIGKFSCSGTREFTPPSQGIDRDWLLVLDDSTQNFSIPGATEHINK